ncbi:hypothetical protein [Seinonella peptonophila]|uniref:hypothetical protein n=1 Tax=Seinonella peptonophila TaxID=112248 RepID=UPI001114D104|nr:hypothetical protein [Seinonella peptonophila]
MNAKLITIIADNVTHDEYHSKSLILPLDFTMCIPVMEERTLGLFEINQSTFDQITGPQTIDREPIRIYGTGPSVHWVSNTQWFINGGLIYGTDGQFGYPTSEDTWTEKGKRDYLCYFVTRTPERFNLQQVKWGMSKKFFQALQHGQVKEEYLQYPDCDHLNLLCRIEFRNRGM